MTGIIGLSYQDDKNVSWSKIIRTGRNKEIIGALIKIHISWGRVMAQW